MKSLQEIYEEETGNEAMWEEEYGLHGGYFEWHYYPEYVEWLEEKLEDEIDMTHDEIVELEMYTSLEGSEIGEVCSKMLSLYNSRDYIGTSLYKEVVKELKWHLHNFKTECEIVDVEVPASSYKTLEWKL
jgi:hypothetical protein